MDIHNKVAIVTGGASGLGEATVRRLQHLGARVSIFDLNQERGQALMEELGPNILYQTVDVTDEASVQNAITSTKETFGDIHICCNFAGISLPRRTVNKEGPHPLDLFKQVIDVNLVGAFNVLRLVAAEMANNTPIDSDGARGVVINTASVAAYEGQVGQASYTASKAGIVGMTLPIARDLSIFGVRCNTLVPGTMMTPMMQLAPESLLTSLKEDILFPKRLGKPEEIASLAMFMIENDYLNGECIRLDGGVRLKAK